MTQELKLKSDTTRLQCFAFLWAMSTFFQLFAQGSFIKEILSGSFSAVLESLLLVAAGVTVLRPTFGTLLFLCCAQIITAGYALPHIPNNRLLTLFVNLTFIFACVQKFVVSDGQRNSGKSLYEIFSRAVGVELVVFYFYAVLAKLNADFLNPETSCASIFYGRVAASIPLFPNAPWAHTAAIYLTVGAEALVPLLIVFRQTRILGIALGMIFHFTLSLDFFQHVMDFSSLMFALYFVLLSGPFVENGRRVLFRSRSADSISNELLWARLFIVLSLAIVIVSGLILTPSASEIFLNSRQVLWLAYGAFLVALFFCSAIRSYFRDPSLRSLFGGGTVFMAIPIGLVFLNGMGPYVGFKSRSSFDMYSSLRMEEPMPNHLLLRHSLDILGYQRDLVTIVDSNNSMLLRIRDSGYAMLFFEFSRIVHDTPGLTVRYVRGGTEQTIASEAERTAIKPAPWILRKFLSFRNVDQSPRVRCDW